MENTELENLEKEHMTTLVSCINKLQTAGYNTQFQASPAGLMSLKTEKVFQPADVKIIHFYRFEGESNPSDSSILYAIEASDGEKGTLVDGYGTESDMHVSTFMNQVEEMSK
jgi:predicted deacetylase